MLQSRPSSEGPAEFDGYIDVGKELSVLHSLLTESLSKVAPAKLAEVDRLPRILERIRMQLAAPALAPTLPPTLATHLAPNLAPEPPAFQSLQRNIFR